MSLSSRDTLLLLFDRPTEPIFMPRGKGGLYILDVPDAFLEARFRSIRDILRARFQKQGIIYIPVANITFPDLTIPRKLGLKESFTLFYPEHRKMAAYLTNIFISQRNIEDLVSMGAYCHDRINPFLFNYSLSVAIIQRTDTRDLQVPNIFQGFPGKFIDSSIFALARKEASVLPSASREPIVIPLEFTATSREPEQAMAYFREDIGINLHHWHWHLVYPLEATDRALVAKDRRGELFYYMHEQLIARYNAERFSNGFDRVKSYSNLRDVIAEGYFPKLEVLVASRHWPPRFPNTPLSDVNRPNDQFVTKISDLEGWIQNIQNSIFWGVVQDNNGQPIALTEDTGIDTLGNIVEASILTPNSKMYGDYHNMGHVLIALCHDPDGRFKESFAVMGDTATAMRDPVFYRWHNHINQIFLQHKDKLPTYPVSRLEYRNVSITDLQVTVANKPLNKLFTFWEQSDVDMSRGLDFAPRGPLFIRFTHLQHIPFTYVIKVNNSSSSQLLGTMRIFIAPRFNERGVAMSFNEQRGFMIELDKFKVTIRQGNNTITRSSADSSVTIPYERTFRNLDAGRPAGGTGLDTFNFCGCGWPDHMLIPKGKTTGLVCDLFAMVSNYNDDRIVQDVTGVCDDADSYCGVQNKKYPDKRSMGYPFDRMGRWGVGSLGSFLTPNMKVQEVTITFEDRVAIRPPPPPPPFDPLGQIFSILTG